MLQPGVPAPDFELPDAAMDMVKLSDFRGSKSVVIYFYHHDDDPGCTAEAIEFSDLTGHFDRAGAVVLGISLDDPICHEEFRDRHGIEICLLSDGDQDVSRSYHTLREIERNGVVKFGNIRSTFVVDRAGLLRHALYNVTPRGHAREVLTLIQTLDA